MNSDGQLDAEKLASSVLLCVFDIGFPASLLCVVLSEFNKKAILKPIIVMLSTKATLNPFVCWKGFSYNFFLENKAL